MVRRVVLVSGGTGGHLMPALALARELRERGHEPLLLTEGREVERDMVQRELPDLPALPLLGATPGWRPGRFAVPLWLARTALAARRTLREARVDCVVSTGGRASVPVGLAAKSLGVPLFLLEQNAVTGRANRLLTPIARQIYHGLPNPRHARALVTGTPLRPEVGRVDRGEARRQLGVVSDAPLVLVVGGSQGARALNEVVPRAIAELRRPVAVLHLAGAGRDGDVERLYRAAGDHVDAVARPSAGDMARLYAAADLVVCRGGGTTVAELIAAGRAAVIVPYPHHRDRQQVHNAEVLVRLDAAVRIEEHELTVTWLADILDALLADGARLRRMGDAARAASSGDATAAIVDDIERQNGWAGGTA